MNDLTATTSVPGTGEHALRRSLHELRRTAEADRLVTITGAIAQAVTAAEVFEAVVDRVAIAIGASSAALWLVEDDGQTVTLARSLGYSGSAARQFDRLSLDAQPSTPALDSIRRGEPIWIPSQEALIEAYPHLGSAVTPGRSYRVSCMPLISHGRTLGALGLTIEGARDIGEEERDFLLLVAQYAGQAIERLRLLEAERRSRAAADAAAARMATLSRENVAARSRAEQLYHFAKSVVSAEKVDDVFEAALDAIGTALATNRGAILIHDDSKVMRFRAWRGLSESYRRAVEGHSPWPPDAVAPQPVLVPDVAEDPTMAPYAALFRDEGIGSLAFIPLVTRGQLIGKFMVYYDHPHSYSSNELALAASIANHLASVTARFAAIGKLEETIRYNELFAGVLAHDLRNPLGAILNAAQLMLMRQEGEGDRNAKPLSRILSSGQRMVRMIDQLLDLTRARVGRGIQIQAAAANLADLCTQAVAELELTYPSWRIEREAAGDLGGTWDADRLLQIISNLVTNAGQHGRPDGRIQLRLDGREPEVVTFQVQNEGVIPEAVLPTIFDPFRGTRQRRDYSQGLGLGLFIVHELVRAHGGSVGVVSSPAEGTTFTVRLPRNAPG
jgi:signal transduction histidine kinase